MSRKLPPNHQRPPAVAACEACGGSGVWVGMLHSGSCDACRGAGVVRKNDGATLPPDQAISVLRAALRRRTEQLRRLRAVPGVQEAVKEHRRREQERAIHPPGRMAMD